MLEILKAPFPRRVFFSFLDWVKNKRKRTSVSVPNTQHISGDSTFKKIASVWDAKGLSREANRKLNWMDFSVVEESINERISGDSRKNWLMWVGEKYCKKKSAKGLVLGCGDGALERHGISLGLCDHFDAFDASPKSIEFARTMAQQQDLQDKITYQVYDVNNIILSESTYDYVFCAMSLHYFSQLEHVLNQIKNSLKPSGLLIFNEYVGPSQFQWADKQLNIINRLLKLLPDKYCKDLSRLGLTLKKEVFRPSIEDMTRIDPSEAIRSEKIIPLVKQYFQILEKVDYGGTLLHTLLHNIVGNFDPQEEGEVTILRLLYFFEMLLIEEGVFNSDFTLVIANRKE